MSNLEISIAELEYELEQKRQKLIEKDIEKQKKEQIEYNKEKSKWITKKSEEILKNIQKKVDEGKPIDIICPECAKTKDIGIENHTFKEGEPSIQITPGRLLIRLRIIKGDIICPMCNKKYEII